MVDTASSRRGFLTCNKGISPISVYAVYDNERLRSGGQRDMIGDVVYEHSHFLYYEACMINGCIWYL